MLIYIFIIIFGTTLHFILALLSIGHTRANIWADASSRFPAREFTDAPRKPIICSRLRCSMKVSNENALTFFCGLILHLLSVDLQLIELVSTTYDGCCYY